MTGAHTLQSDLDVAARPRGVIGGLDGIRVLDFGRYIAAPYCAAMLADQGAEVIRIDPPEGASDREVMPIGVEGRGSLYLQMNRNKKSLTLDYMTGEGRLILNNLVRISDIVVVNLPNRALVKLGLDYESLRAINPNVILTTISAFAFSGKDRDRVGFDGMGQALSGAMYLSGTGERPMRAAVSYVDYATGASAAFATMAALAHRMRTGEGQHVECSLMGTALTMMNPILIEEATGTRRRVATANRSPIASPSDLFKVTDGWLMVQVIGNAMFNRWTELVGLPELSSDPRFSDDIQRGENGEVLSDIMALWCADRTLSECLAAAQAARIPMCPVLTPGEALAAFGDSSYFAQGAEGLPIATANTRTVASTTLGMRTAPDLGEHTDEILGGLQISVSEISKLRQEGII